MRRLFSALLLMLVTPALSGQAQQRPALDTLKTTAEASNFESTSTYADVMAFMTTVAEASPLIHLTSYGTTFEQRMMPLAVVGTGLKDGSPASVLATGKLRVHIQGNIHAGEVEGKESAQILLREFAQGRHAEWLESMVFLITPIFNADGNERFGLRNRGRQHGPINGMGTRANAQNININRDFMKLETPEARAFVKLWNDYDPHVGMDLHTSNGSTHAYHLTYSPPLNPNTSAHIMSLMKDEWFPFVTTEIRRKHGWETFYYGNISNPGGRGGRGGATDAQPPAPAGPRAWGTFEHVPRFHNNYVGLRNRFALLSEAYSYATFEDRIKATSYFIEESMNFAHRNAARIKKAVEDADREALAARALATRARIATGGMIEILMGEVEDDKNPVDGALMSKRKDVVIKEQVIDRLWFEPTATETAPLEYYIPADATAALDLLRTHGVVMRQVTQPVSGLHHYAIKENTQAPPRAGIDINGHALRTLTGEWVAGDAAAPAGSWVVPMNQPLARLAFYLLEPNSDDGVTTWNFLDPMLGEGVTRYPILRKQ